MSNGFTPLIPAIAAKYWLICDGCGVESVPTNDSLFERDLLPDDWAAMIVRKKAPLHFCPECIPTMYINGVALDAKAAEVLGEDYFK